MTTTTRTRPSQIANQLDMFDLLTLAEPVTAPLGFTIDPYSPEELTKSADRWRAEYGNMASGENLTCGTAPVTTSATTAPSLGITRRPS